MKGTFIHLRSMKVPFIDLRADRGRQAFGRRQDRHADG